jgi:hypothetical protein
MLPRRDPPHRGGRSRQAVAPHGERAEGAAGEGPGHPVQRPLDDLPPEEIDGEEGQRRVAPAVGRCVL